jgi:hypothetical protein
MNVNQIKIVLQIQGIPEKTKENYQVTLQSQNYKKTKGGAKLIIKIKIKISVFRLQPKSLKLNFFSPNV